jgi:hypothetical protein
MKKMIMGVGLMTAFMFGALAFVPVAQVHWQWGFTRDNPFLNPSEWGNTQNLNVVGSGQGQSDSFVNVVRWAINWILGILALIALIMLLWWGFQMVTAAGDDGKYTAGFTILKQAAIGLVLIGVARFVISLIFFLVNLTTGTGQGGAGTAG